MEFPTQKEARAAIEGANETKLLDQTIGVEYAFVRPPPKEGKGARAGGGGGKGRRGRSRSPEEEKEE